MNTPPNNLGDPFGPFLKRPRSALCPIFGERDGQTELLGSGVLIKIDLTHFLLTAAHVLDHEENYDLLIPGKNSLIGLNGYRSKLRMPASGNRDSDFYDIGYCRFKDAFASGLDDSLTYLGPEDVDFFDKTRLKDAYTLIGFPITKSEVQRKVVSTEQVTLSGEGTDVESYSRLGRSIQHHLIVQYRYKKAISYKTFRRSSTPKPYGMSGGGIFAWSKKLPDIRELRQPSLVGILTEHHRLKHVFIGTRINCFLTCILKNNPTLSVGRAPAFSHNGNINP